MKRLSDEYYDLVLERDQLYEELTDIPKDSDEYNSIIIQISIINERLILLE